MLVLGKQYMHHMSEKMTTYWLWLVGHLKLARLISLLCCYAISASIVAFFIRPTILTKPLPPCTWKNNLETCHKIAGYGETHSLIWPKVCLRCSPTPQIWKHILKVFLKQKVFLLMDQQCNFLLRYGLRYKIS